MHKLVLVPPPVIALLLLGLGFGLDALFPGLPKIALPALGIVLAASGIALGVLALLRFKAQGTTPIPHGEPSALVLAGPYLWTRNPMYLGLLTALAGCVLYFGGSPLFIALPGFFVLISKVHIAHEEAKLAGLFGEAYAAFKASVPRWL
jgi:protein-S-isoprenylcysteine O-methyltransferase Ste14